MTLLYNFSIFLFQMSIKGASVFGNQKAGKWLDGRKNIFSHIQNSLKPGEERVWFHCASLGEFEQGRPVMEKFKMQNSKCKIVLTFFSPSGYEVRKNYGGADCIFYLPMDTSFNAEKFISLINPSKVFFVKYEFWFHYLRTLSAKKIPVYLVSAIFRPQQIFFKWYGGFFRSMLKLFTHIFLQDNGSADLLSSIGITSHTVAGDTRVDRVVEAAAAVKPIPLIEKFKDNKPLMIAGSTWKEDEQIIQSLIKHHTPHQSPFKLVIAPHEINEQRLDFLLNLFAKYKTVRFSMAKAETISSFDVLIIDNIGMLSSVYQYGNFGYIGGGFGKGIHNILEAAVFGMPVFFGPNYSMFTEAVDLIKRKGAFSIQTADDFINVMRLMNEESKSMMAALVTKKYTNDRKGATEIIMKMISDH